jgi:hypothetical protein
MIHLLWCTIRTGNFPNIFNHWLTRSKFKNFDTHVLVSTENEKVFLENYFQSLNLNNRIVVFNPPYRGVCLPSYKLSSSLEAQNSDIVIFGSDDFTPPQNWDEYLINKLQNRTGALLVNDGYQALDFSNMAEPIFSIPVMTFDCLVRLNKIIYNPAYTHLCSDAELFMNLKELNLIIDERANDFNYIFEHHHWSSGKRQADQNDQSYYNNFEKDKKTWEFRKKLSLEKRLEVSVYEKEN